MSSQMKPLTQNPDLKIGLILKTARVRAGKSTTDIATALDVSTNIVRLWERDIRGIGRWWKNDDRVQKVFVVYELTQEEIQEVLKRVSLRKQEYTANSLKDPRENTGSISSSAESSEEMKVLVQLMALTAEKRQWVIQAANAYRALNGNKK